MNNTVLMMQKNFELKSDTKRHLFQKWDIISDVLRDVITMKICCFRY